MSKAKLILESMLRKFGHIDTVVARHGGVDGALDDEPEGRAAILMNIVAIAEKFEQLKSMEATEILGQFDKADIAGISKVRNKIAHHYDEILLEPIKIIIENDLPRVLSVIKAILQDGIVKEILKAEV